MMSLIIIAVCFVSFRLHFYAEDEAHIHFTHLMTLPVMNGAERDVLSRFCRILGWLDIPMRNRSTIFIAQCRLHHWDNHRFSRDIRDATFNRDFTFFILIKRVCVQVTENKTFAGNFGIHSNQRVKGMAFGPCAGNRTAQHDQHTENQTEQDRGYNNRAAPAVQHSLFFIHSRNGRSFRDRLHGIGNFLRPAFISQLIRVCLLMPHFRTIGTFDALSLRPQRRCR